MMQSSGVNTNGSTNMKLCFSWWIALLLDRLTDVLVKSLEVKWKSRWKFNTQYTSAGELQHECEHYHYDGKTCFFCHNWVYWLYSPSVVQGQGDGVIKVFNEFNKFLYIMQTVLYCHLKVFCVVCLGKFCDNVVLFHNRNIIWLSGCATLDTFWHILLMISPTEIPRR